MKKHICQECETNETDYLVICNNKYMCEECYQDIFKTNKDE